MITKEELLAALEDSSRALDKSNEIYGLALKGLESESTVKRLIQSRDQWRKKHDDLADELDDKIIALEDKLKNTVSLKYHVQLLTLANQKIDPLRNERNAFQRLVGELEIEKSCIRADLENVCKDRDALKDKIEVLETEIGLKDDDWGLSVSYYMNLAAAWEERAEEMRAKLKKFEAFFTSED